MAVFRVEKNKNYTVMSNHHLKDKTLTLKSKGLLSMILSLPEEWNYTTRGLAAISKEGVDCIGATLRELETAGYIERNQLRDDKGRITDTEYVIYEFPQPKREKKPKSAKPDTASPHTPAPCTENPYMDRSCTEKAALLNTDVINAFNNQDTDSSTIHQSIRQPADGYDRYPRSRSQEIDSMDTMERYRDILMDNLEFDILRENNPHRAEELDEIFEIMLDAVCSTKKTIRIEGDDKPAEVVKSRLLKLNSLHMEYVLECLTNNTTDVRNIKSYLLTTLYNASLTIDSYYQARVNHDLYGR